METSDDVFFREFGGTCTELRQAFARHVSMSAPRLHLLMRLHRDGETSHRSLGRALSLDGATVTRLVKEFEAEGLTTRRVDPSDNRFTLARLTPHGERVTADLDESHQAYQARLLKDVSAQDRETVLRVLATLRAGIEAEAAR
ncbi:MarR family winged helix-turn-helix transcriptional regulator [Spirillospora sp. NBC_01491]|uniref:MarR family winged helix-turn-helix transcriptional regulator n=1 Tax=Spirillospora sp. NBC_01491 TaxID=2976007 RepID=UPI002E3713C7|nr:MarR family winged helix-turn-helix transcriptional regulator [Spirillospora sp. NBC_01491]